MKSVSILLVFVMSLLLTSSPQTASIPNNQAEKETIINPFEIFIDSPMGDNYYFSISGDLMTIRKGDIYYLNNYGYIEHRINTQNVKLLNEDEIYKINAYVNSINDFSSNYGGVWEIHFIILEFTM